MSHELDVEVDCAPQPMRRPDLSGLVDESAIMSDPRFASVLKKLESGQIPKVSSSSSSSSTPKTPADEKIPDIIAYGFCKLVFDFLEALRVRFPNRKMVQKSHAMYWQLVQRMPSLPYERFKDLVNACGEEVFKKRTPENEALVVQQLMKSPIFRIMKIHEIWCPELDEETKETIWEYVNRLVDVTRLISSFDPQLKDMINSISMDSLKSVGSDGNNINVDKLLEELEQRILEDNEFMAKLLELASKQ
jgi:hypothetical protein